MKNAHYFSRAQSDVFILLIFSNQQSKTQGLICYHQCQRKMGHLTFRKLVAPKDIFWLKSYWNNWSIIRIIGNWFTFDRQPDTTLLYCQASCPLLYAMITLLAAGCGLTFNGQTWESYQSPNLSLSKKASEGISQKGNDFFQLESS